MAGAFGALFTGGNKGGDNSRHTVNTITSNNLAGAAADLPKEAEKQNKDYCMLCYKSFGVFTFKYHCRTCGRTCCGDCSI